MAPFIKLGQSNVKKKTLINIQVESVQTKALHLSPTMSGSMTE
jgi:hypothetical protein